jgi:hypothetical protein
MNPLINLILSRLSKSQQELLIYAAQEGICQFVEYESGKYIGVDAQYNRKLIPEQEEGIWSIGRIKPN